MSISPALILPPLLDSVCSVLPAGLEIYLVGGAVRDLLLGRETHDLDFALQGDGIRVARAVADALGADVYPLDPARATGRVLLTTPDGRRHVLDFAALRGADLEADLRGRDFTLNAIALDLSDRLLRDPLGGVADLRAGCLRQCSTTTFRDDPLRILRGIRLAAAFNFSIQPETRLAMKRAGELLVQVSAERQRDELFRILEGPKPAACLRALDLLGVFEWLFPDLGGMKGLVQPAPHVQDAWSHSLSAISHLEALLAALSPEYDPGNAADLWLGSLVLRLGRYRQKLAAHFADPLTPNRSRRGLLFLAVLYHDAAKPLTTQPGTSRRLPFPGHDRQGAQLVQDLARRLALSKDEASVLAMIIRHHMLIPAMVREQLNKGRPPSRRAVYRFFHQTGGCGVDLTLLALANLRATHEQALAQDEWSACLDVCRALLEAWWENHVEQIDPPALLRGEDVMGAFGLQPGPRIGKLLELVREAQASGVVHSREQALQFLRRRLR